jgi:predicted nucleotidyltransferase
MVEKAARTWAANEARRHPGLLKLGYFGSYARGDAGVGSDLDFIAIIDHTEEPFERRALKWDLYKLPVPVDMVVYTLAEFEKIIYEKGRFGRVLQTEVKWIYVDVEVDE